MCAECLYSDQTRLRSKASHCINGWTLFFRTVKIYSLVSTLLKPSRGFLAGLSCIELSNKLWYDFCCFWCIKKPSTISMFYSRGGVCLGGSIVLALELYMWNKKLHLTFFDMLLCTRGFSILARIVQCSANGCLVRRFSHLMFGHLQLLQIYWRDFGHFSLCSTCQLR